MNTLAELGFHPVGPTGRSPNFWRNSTEGVSIAIAQGKRTFRAYLTASPLGSEVAKDAKGREIAFRTALGAARHAVAAARAGALLKLSQPAAASRCSTIGELEQLAGIERNHEARLAFWITFAPLGAKAFNAGRAELYRRIREATEGSPVGT